MRVLVLTDDYVPRAWSGIGAAVAVQAAAIARRGVGVDVLVPDAGVARDADRGGGLEVHALGRSRFGLRPERYDVVHVHSLGLAELALELRRRFGIPLVYTAHASLQDELGGRAGTRGWTRAQDRLQACSDALIFPSAHTRDRAIRRQPGLSGRSRVVANGLRVVPRPGTAAARSGPVVFAGRFAATKGLPLLRDVIAGLAGHPALRFVLAGGHGDPQGRRLVGDLVARHPERCRTVGWLEPEALDRLLRSASMVLMPSRYEPFGMVALEAMRAGAPVLAAATGGLTEVVGPGSGGMLLRPGSAEDWRRTIVELWNAPERRAALAHRGRRHVAEHFDCDVLAGRLVDEVYRPLAEARAR